MIFLGKIVRILKISKENGIFQQILSIKENRNKRKVLNKIFVEGVQNINDALNNGWEIDSLFFTDFNNLSGWAKNIVSNYSTNNYELTLPLMKKLSDKTDTSELVAIFKMKEQEITIKSENPILLFLDRPSKKGNFGNILRSADAFNVDLVLYSGHSVDIYDHEVISASMGSFFKIPFKFLSSNLEFENFVENAKMRFPNLKIVATSLQAEKSIDKENFTGPIILLMGNERAGLGKHYYELADSVVKIDMNENIDSLNLACATSVFLYEINRQRGYKYEKRN